MGIKVIRPTTESKAPFRWVSGLSRDVVSILATSVVGALVIGIFSWMMAISYLLGRMILAIVATAVLGPATVYVTRVIKAASENGKRNAVVVSLIVTEIGAVIFCMWAADSIPTAHWISGIPTWAPVGCIFGLIWGFRCWSWARLAIKYFDPN